jgi:hypothetical protein
MFNNLTKKNTLAAKGVVDGSVHDLLQSKKNTDREKFPSITRSAT